MAAEPLTEVEFPAADDPTRPVKLAEYWGSELTAFKNWAEKYTTRSLKIEARYLDEREKAEMTGVSVLNLFWSNTEVMIAALYARAPTIDVSRTFRDPNDDIGRVAANRLAPPKILGGRRCCPPPRRGRRSESSIRLVVGMG